MVEHNFLRKFFGFLFTLFLLASVTCYNLYNLTSYKSIERFSSPILHEVGFASFIDTYYPQIIELARSNPEVSLQFPGIPFDLDIRGKDIANLNQQELAEYFVSRLLRAIYREPNNLKLPYQAKEQIGPLVFLANIFNYRTHELLRLITLVLMGISLVFLLPLVYLSSGFAKVTSPGWSMVVVGLPLFVSIFVSSIAIDRILVQRVGISMVIIKALKALLLNVQTTYLILLLLGAFLVIVGKVGEVVFRKS